MPKLKWSSKSQTQHPDGELLTDSILTAQEREKSPEIPPNRLILGDNLLVMDALLDEFEGKINLIYADPPFFTNKGYSARVGRGEDSRKPEEWQLAEGYQDEWDDLDSEWYREKLLEILKALILAKYQRFCWHRQLLAKEKLVSNTESLSSEFDDTRRDNYIQEAADV